jgi:hypothetical protein
MGDVVLAIVLAVAGAWLATVLLMVMFTVVARAIQP